MILLIISPADQTKLLGLGESDTMDPKLSKASARSDSSDLILQELKLLREEVSQFREAFLKFFDASSIADSKETISSNKETGNNILKCSQSNAVIIPIAAKFRPPREAQRKSIAPKLDETSSSNKNSNKIAVGSSFADSSGTNAEPVEGCITSGISVNFKLDDGDEEDYSDEYDETNRTPLDRKELSFNPNQKFLENLFVASPTPTPGLFSPSVKAKENLKEDSTPRKRRKLFKSS